MLHICWLNEHFSVFAQQRRRRAAPQAESDLGIMILGMFALFAHSAPHYSFQKSFTLSLKTDAFGNVLLIQIVSFESPWFQQCVDKTERDSLQTL